MLIVGLLLNLAGGLLLLPLDRQWGSLDVGWRLGMIGLGNGFIGPPNQGAILAASPSNLMGTVSVLSGLGRNLGLALGPAFASILWVAGQLTPDAMRPAFSLLALFPVLALLSVLLPPGASPRGAQPRRGGIDVASHVLEQGEPVRVYDAV